MIESFEHNSSASKKGTNKFESNSKKLTMGLLSYKEIK